jgi:DNA-binding MarR family transcriptional regulator
MLKIKGDSVMKNRITQSDRLQIKTAEARIGNYFEKRYKFSPVISEALTSDTLFFNSVFGNNRRLDGQIIYYAVKNEEPAGKSLKECQYVKLTLTLYKKNDIGYRKENGLKELRLRIIKRICDEAVLQEACLTHEDIAELLFLDRTTVGLYIKILEERGQYIQTRANFTDQSKKYTHKEQIIKLFFMNLSETEIAQRTNHNLLSVEQYIKSFLRISLLYQEKKSEGEICRLSAMSPGLVKEYITLYQKLEEDSYYKESFIKKLTLYRIDLSTDLSNFNTSPFKKRTMQEIKI